MRSGRSLGTVGSANAVCILPTTPCCSDLPAPCHFLDACLTPAQISTAHIISRIHTSGIISWTCRSHYFLDIYVSHCLPDHVQHRLSDLQVTHHFQDPTSAIISWIHRSHVISWIHTCWVLSWITMSHTVSQIITPHIISWILTCPLISCIHTSHVLLQGGGLHLKPIRRHLVPQSRRCCISVKEQLGIEGPTLGIWPYHPQSEIF